MSISKSLRKLEKRQMSANTQYVEPLIPGRPAYTTPLPARLANRNNTPVVMFTAKRKGMGKGWVMQAKRLAPFSEDATIAAAELNIAIENAVLVAPEQFIWSYNRYKHPLGAELPPST